MERVEAAAIEPDGAGWDVEQALLGLSPDDRAAVFLRFLTAGLASFGASISLLIASGIGSRSGFSSSISSPSVVNDATIAGFAGV